MNETIPQPETDQAPAPEDTRALLRFGGCVLTEARKTGDDAVICTFFGARGARLADRSTLLPDIHWFRCTLSPEEPLMELVFRGGFYKTSVFAPVGMDLADTEIEGRLVEHDAAAFPERVVLDAVKIYNWEP